MHFSTLLPCLTTLTLVKGLDLADDRSSPRDIIDDSLGIAEKLPDNFPRFASIPDQQHWTITETVTVVEITVSEECAASAYAAGDSRQGLSNVAYASPGVGSAQPDYGSGGESPAQVTGSGSAPPAECTFRTIYSTATHVVYNTSHMVDIETITKSTATVFNLPSLTSVTPETAGVLNTELGEAGQPTANPLLTKSIPTLASLPASSQSVPSTTGAVKTELDEAGQPTANPLLTQPLPTLSSLAAASQPVPPTTRVQSPAEAGNPAPLFDDDASSSDLNDNSAPARPSPSYLNQTSASVQPSSSGLNQTRASLLPSSSRLNETSASVQPTSARLFPNSSSASYQTGYSTTNSSALSSSGQPLRYSNSTLPLNLSTLMPLVASTMPEPTTSSTVSSETSETAPPTEETASPTEETAPPTEETAPPTEPAKIAQGDIFAKQIEAKPLAARFSVEADHPVPRAGIQTKGAIQTNKFYSNFFLGNQQDPTYTYPYSVSWVGGTGVSGSYGMAVSHIEEKQRVFGPPAFNVPASYYINPIGIQSMIISAKELGPGTTLTIDSMTAFSARVNLSANKASEPAVSFPLVQGMAYITAQYSGATPLVQSSVFFRNMTRTTRKPKENVTRYTFLLEDGTIWRVYGYKTKGDDLDLQVLNNGVAMSSKPFYGILQVVKETGANEAANTKRADNVNDALDDGAAIYPVTMTISGSVSGSTGTYEFTYEKAGHQDGELVMFALPHHTQSFDTTTLGQAVNGMVLMTPTKGSATLVRGTRWTMVEASMPTGLGFEPFDMSKGSMKKISDSAKRTIHAAASKESLENMVAATDLDSMYFSGKALAKYAHLVFVIQDMLGDTKLAQAGLGQLKTAFARFADNKQKFPLAHDAAWGGVVSKAGYAPGQALADFGNTYYNDHHFHYGYHILTAAVIGHLDKSWIADNKDYVNMLVRDTSNPSAADPLFPMWRTFDWYHGHSWAAGLFPSLDGKNQESTSEDMMHAYALKMWGRVSGDAHMEARADLQLAVMARSMRNYYLYEKTNTIQPRNFIGNKVAGILFENKVDHTTFFSNQIESIQGIHMIPILPVTTVARSSSFVKEEWEQFFSNGRAEAIDNGWKSILLGNYATIAPKEAFAKFSAPTFDVKWLDGGVSLTWLLAYSAALGGL